MQPIKDIIGNVLGDLSGHKPKAITDWEGAWKNLGSLAKGSKPIGYKDGCLTVMIDTAARRVVLQANQQLIMTTLKQLGEVNRIYYKVGKV